MLNKALDDVVKITMTENEMGASVLSAAQTPNFAYMANDGTLLLYLAKFSAEQVEQRARAVEAALPALTTTVTLPDNLTLIPTP